MTWTEDPALGQMSIFLEKLFICNDIIKTFKKNPDIVELSLF